MSLWQQLLHCLPCLWSWSSFRNLPLYHVITVHNSTKSSSRTDSTQVVIKRTYIYLSAWSFLCSWLDMQGSLKDAKPKGKLSSTYRGKKGWFGKQTHTERRTFHSCEVRVFLRFLHSALNFMSFFVSPSVVYRLLERSSSSFTDVCNSSEEGWKSLPPRSRHRVHRTTRRVSLTNVTSSLLTWL